VSRGEENRVVSTASFFSGTMVHSFPPQLKSSGVRARCCRITCDRNPRLMGGAPLFDFSPFLFDSAVSSSVVSSFLFGSGTGGSFGDGVLGGQGLFFSPCLAPVFFWR